MGFLNKINLFLLLFTLINKCSCDNIESNINTYLADRYENFRSKLSNSFSQYYDNIRDVQMNIKLINSHKLQFPSKPLCFNMLNNTYILLKDNIFTLTLNGDTILFKRHSLLPRAGYDVLFVKNIEYNDLVLVTVVFKNGFTNIYSYKENIWTLIQTLENPGYVKNVNLFVQNDVLYLFFVHNYYSSYIPSTLLKWSGKVFQEVDDILTTGAQSNVYFKTENTHIFVISQTPADPSLVGIYVLQMNNGQIKKKNFLNTKGTDLILTYLLNNERYIITMKNGKRCIIYWWDGNYFMKWKHLKTPIKYLRAEIYYIRNQPVLFTATQNELIIYKIKTDNIHVVTTLPFEKYYWQITNIDFTTNDENTIIYVTGISNEKYPEIFMLSVDIRTNETTENPRFNEDSLIKCYLELNEKLNHRSKLLENIRKKSRKILQTNKNIRFNGVISTKHDIILNENVIHNKLSNEYYEENQRPIQIKLKILKDKMEIMNQNMKLSGPVKIKGHLHAEKLITPALQTEKINNYNWNPNMWLSKSKEQIIYAPIYAKSIVSKQINITNPKHFLNELLMLNGNQKITGQYSFKSLKANNIIAERINYIPINKMYQISKPQLIKNRKYFTNLSANTIQTNKINKKKSNIMLNFMQNYIIYDFRKIRNLNVKHFNFEIINGINWENLTNSLFELDKSSEIKGDVIIHSDVKINNLIINKINDRNASELITTSTDQEITADMQLAQIHVKNIISSDINGLSFQKDIATFKNNHVSGPVTIKNIHVTGNVNGLKFPVNDFKDTVQLHYYDGHVKIKGNLILNNVSLSDDTELYYKKKIVPENFIQKYWLKSQNQVIPTPFTATQGISVTTLNTTYINDISFVYYSTYFNHDKDMEYTFKSVLVGKDFNCDKNNSNLNIIDKILNESVRKQGRYTIYGHNNYVNSLKIQNLKTIFLDNTKISDVAKINSFNNFTGIKTFQNLIINDNLELTNQKLIIKEINNFPIIDLLNRTVFINRPGYINNLILEKETATKSLSFRNANENNADEMQAKVLHLFNMDQLKKVKIHGNLILSEIYNAKQVNNIDIVKYLSEVVNIKDKITINGKIQFKKNVFTDRLSTDLINDIKVNNIAETYLCYNKDQVIQEEFVFDSIATPHLITPAINDINTNSLIDRKSKKDIHIHSNLIILSLSCESTTAKLFNNNLKELVHNLNILPSKMWSNITVLKDINFSKAAGNFGRIITNAVNSLQSNIITEKVTFDYLHAKKIDLLKSKINNVNIKKIYEDALKNIGDNQKVTGHNTFTKFSAARMKINRNANIKNINHVNILKLNNTIFDKKDLNKFPVKGHKYFTYEISVSHLKVPPKVHNISVKDLTTTGTLIETWPNVRFKKLKISRDFDVPFIKNVNLTHLLTNRIKCHSKTPQIVHTKLQFNNIYFSGNITTKTINDIELRNIVVDNGEQFIQNSKWFEKPIHIFGDFYVKLFNSHKITNIYDNAILTGENVTIPNNIIFNSPISIHGDIICNQINGINITNLIEIVQNGSHIRTGITIAAYDELKSIMDQYSYLITDKNKKHK